MEITEAELKKKIKKALLEELRSRFRSAMPYIGEIMMQTYKQGKGVSEIAVPLIEIYELPKYSNPISILLVEGITASFPVDKTIEYVKRHFGDLIGNVIRGTNDWTHEKNNNIHIFVEAEPNLIDKISRVMGLCGYYLAIPLYRIQMGNHVWLQYEPRYDKSMTQDLKRNERYLLHLTPKVYTEKILKNGLAPHSRNKYLTYPERVYLLRGGTPYTELENMCYSLSRVYNIKRKDPVWTYDVLSINTSLLPDDFKIFEDPNYPVYGLYTTDNIPPKAIAKIDTLEAPDIYRY